MKRFLSLIRNSSQEQFLLKSFLVKWFGESTSNNLMNLYRCTDDFVSFLTVKQHLVNRLLYCWRIREIKEKINLVNPYNPPTVKNPPIEVTTDKVSSRRNRSRSNRRGRVRSHRRHTLHNRIRSRGGGAEAPRAWRRARASRSRRNARSRQRAGG